MKSKSLNGEEASVSIEMAIMIVVITMAIMAFIDVATIVNAKTKISNAVSVGSKYAISKPTDTSGLPAVVKSASSLNATDVNVTVSQFCECAAVSASCGSTCASGLATFTSISSSYIVPLIGNYPYFPKPFIVSESIKVRVQ